ncbi:NDOR1 family protein [Megaselia abdita]
MRLLILYGSETGNAKDYAEMIWRQSGDYGFIGPVLSMNDYNIQNLIQENLIVFVCSTTGQGDEPENMKKFWQFLLRRNLPKTSLENLNFACLGLGDSSYEFYNYAAKRLKKRLLNLSAKELIPIGLCDDQHDHGPGFAAIPWIEELWNKLESLYPIKFQKSKKFLSKWVVDECTMNGFNDSGRIEDLDKIDESSLEFTVEKNERATVEGHFQDVRYISFKNEGFKWQCGDVLSIYPSNSQENVDKLFQLFDEHSLPFKRSSIVQFKEVNEEMPLPNYLKNPITIESLATHFWDLSAMPRQRVFEVLLLNCDDEMESWKLGEFIKSEGLEDVINYVNRPRRTILEVLYDFPKSVGALTLSQLVDLFQTISPRSYSIASYPDMSLEILVAIVEYKTKLQDLRRGLCTTFLKNLKPNDKVYGSIKKGTLKIPSNDTSQPLILIGPGTGFAPFRSVLLKKESENLKVPLITFFGCRNKLKDFFYEEDFERFKENEITTKSFFAFSRDQENKIYVQHLIEENKSFLREVILEQNAIIYVAGSSGSMPKSVKEAFITVLDNDKDYVSAMVKNKRYFEETWS